LKWRTHSFLLILSINLFTKMPNFTLTIPAQSRKKLPKDIIMTRGLNDTIYVYSKSDWKKVKKKLANLESRQSTSKALREYIDLFKKGAYETKINSKGKLSIPEYLADYANLHKRSCSLCWIGDRLEIKI